MNRQLKVGRKQGQRFIPVTPGGTMCFYGFAGLSGKPMWAKTEQQAIDNLIKDAAHMPYKTWDNFKARGYTIMSLDDGPWNAK